MHGYAKGWRKAEGWMDNKFTKEFVFINSISKVISNHEEVTLATGPAHRPNWPRDLFMCKPVIRFLLRALKQSKRALKRMV